MKWLLLGALAWAAAVALKSSIGIAIAALSDVLLKSSRVKAAIWGG